MRKQREELQEDEDTVGKAEGGWGYSENNGRGMGIP
jgi:hypothetical protein